MDSGHTPFQCLFELLMVALQMTTCRGSRGVDYHVTCPQLLALKPVVVQVVEEGLWCDPLQRLQVVVETLLRSRPTKVAEKVCQCGDETLWNVVRLLPQFSFDGLQAVKETYR